MQSRLHCHCFDSTLFPHISIVHPEIHSRHCVNALPKKRQNIPNFLHIMLQRFSLPVHGNLAGHEHPDFCLVSILTCVNQLCVLFLELFSMEIQIEYVAEMFQLLRIQPRRHRIKYVFDNLLYHKSLLSFAFHCKGWRL